MNQRLELGQGGYERSIATYRTSFSFVSMNNIDYPIKELSGVLWYGQDAPWGTTYVPLYGIQNSIHKGYLKGHMAKYDSNSAYWIFNFLNNWSQLRFDTIQPEMLDLAKKLEKYIRNKQINMENDFLLSYDEEYEQNRRKLFNKKDTKEHDNVNHQNKNHENHEKHENSFDSLVQNVFGEVFTANNEENKNQHHHNQNGQNSKNNQNIEQEQETKNIELSEEMILDLISKVEEYSLSHMNLVLSQWQELTNNLISKYHNGWKTNFEGDNSGQPLPYGPGPAVQCLGYDSIWLSEVGYSQWPGDSFVEVDAASSSLPSSPSSSSSSLMASLSRSKQPILLGMPPLPTLCEDFLSLKCEKAEL
mmetsp:Transcript_1539/g.1936  ORF Transcript_1539/g.1936 Transcript_1539/m.1936 type:complete len:361 (+) Transcript_1539:260-1342(+)